MIYGGFFWINGEEQFPVPKNAYFMAGAGGQYTIIIPSHQLVVVRLGLYKGSGPGRGESGPEFTIGSCSSSQFKI